MISKAFAAIVMAGLATVANAAVTPVGLWQVDQYDFVTKSKINTVQVCFSGAGTVKHGNPTLGSSEMNGTWKQQGDVVLLRLTSASNKSNTGDYALTIYNQDFMAGYNQSWNTADTSGGFHTTAIFTFKGPSC
jgi:hypothetical protein